MFWYNAWDCTSSAYAIPVWWSWKYVLYLFITIRSELWIINRCWRLGHERMVRDVCLTMFLVSQLLFWINHMISIFHYKYQLANLLCLFTLTPTPKHRCKRPACFAWRNKCKIVITVINPRHLNSPMQIRTDQQLMFWILLENTNICFIWYKYHDPQYLLPLKNNPKGEIIS